MDIFTVYLALLVHFSSLFSYTDGQCVLPIQGQWTMSRTGDNMGFADDVITSWDFPNALSYNTVFRCVDNDVSRYVMKGDDRINGLQHIYVCLDFISVTQDRAVFVQATETGPGTIPTYGTALTEAQATDGVLMDNICNLASPYPTHRYHVFVRTGTSPSIPCPSVLQGLFDLSAPCTATVDVCTDTSLVQMTFSGAACQPNPFDYGSNVLRCLYDASTGTDTYVTLQNDASFVCVVLSESGTTVLMSQNEEECQESQTPTSGGILFSLQKAACPTTTAPPVTTTTTTTPGGRLSSATVNIIIAVVVIAVIALIIIIIIIIICIKRRKRKERERKRAERREQRRAERRRRRFEREERRRQGLPVSDTESEYSTDSGYIRESSSTLNEVDGIITDDKKKKKKRKKNRKWKKKVRKIYDENGILVREEEIPYDPDDSGDDDTVYINKDGKRIRKRKVKKTRTYVRERTLPNGKTVKELVESEYSETCSEYSVTSSEEEDDPVAKEMRRAMRRRKKQRDDMMVRIAERQKDDIEAHPEEPADVPEPRPEEPSSDPDHPGVPSESTDNRPAKPTDRGYRLVEPTEGPVIFRPKHEERVGKELKKGEKKPGFFKRLFKRKHKKAPMEEEIDEDRENRDKYMHQYREKKRIEGKLDDEGFWEDEQGKNTARDVFDIDKLEAILEGSVANEHTEIPPMSTGVIINKEHGASTPNEGDSQSKEGTEPGEQTGKLKAGKESTVKFKENDSDEKQTDDKKGDQKTKKQVTARVSKLLTDRLFPTESKKQGHVIFVKEMKQGQLADTKSQTPGSLPPLKNSTGQRSHPGHKGPAIIDPEKAAIYRDGLAKDQRFIDSIGADGSENVHFEDENGDGSSQHPGASTGLSPLNRPYLKRSQYGQHSAFRGQIPEAWGTGGSNSNSKGDRDRRKVPYTVSAPKFHSYLDFLRNLGSSGKPGNQTDRDASYNREGGGGGKSRRLLMDDARLRRLLEELYKDKKYMDAIIAAEECKNEDKVKDLAVHGRDYLIDMALYWEKQGPLPPRPSVTALGFRLERSKSMFKGGEHDAKPPPLERNKTVC